MRTRDLKRRMEEVEEGYDEAYEEAFSLEFRDFIKPMLHDNDVITEDDLQGFLDSFTFPDQADWCYDKVQSELDDIGDQRYQQHKERDI